MSTLNPNAEKWVEALESGRFEQTAGRLADDDGRCCLGVACDLAVEAGVIESYDPAQGALTLTVRRWLGLRSAWGAYADGAALTQDNDSGRSFAEIAQIIRDNAGTLFVEA